jgi:hypothetical protein
MPACYPVIARFYLYQTKPKENELSVAIIITLVLKVVALAMGTVSIVLGFFPKETNSKTHITLFSIGLTALAFAALLLL